MSIGFHAFNVAQSDYVLHCATSVDINKLIAAFAAELERPRELSPRVMHYIVQNYEVDPNAVGRFLVQEMNKLADDEIDLILSPVFTPKLADQTVFAELLGPTEFPREQWPALVQQLTLRPVRAQLVTPDSNTHIVELHEVTIERYVYRVRLEGVIPESLLRSIEQTVSATDQPLLKAIARLGVWEYGDRREILDSYLVAAGNKGKYSASDAIELLHLVESRKPQRLADLVEHLPEWQQALQSQINLAGGPKPFFSTEVQALHGGARDQRQGDDARLLAKQNELAFIQRLWLLLRD